MHKEIFPGDRVMVWDHCLWIDDKLTPACHRPATVVCRYGRKDVRYPLFMNIDEFSFDVRNYPAEVNIYPDLVDVEFDHKPGEISTAHFTWGVELL